MIDLIEAGARLKLRTGQTYSFSEPDGPLVASSRPAVAELLGKNPHLDPGSRQFLAAYATEMSDRCLPIITSRDHLAHHLGVTAAELAARGRSPGLANIVVRHIDYRLHALGHKEGFSYTRCADDLTFSSNRRELNSMIPFFRGSSATRVFGSTKRRCG
ncbi:MAG: hypothetical protein HYV63_29510 [Candidatus Schekmanbacteria bacterium]|nr:hypothetical protein [Candidatus Schekmanbacteria bacterium]